MHRILVRLFLVLVVIWCSSSSVAGSQQNARGKSKPNILFIVVDDLRPEIGCYGTRARTPNLDRLAASGLLFDRAYCNQAVCGASRVAMMTSLYPEHTGERTYHVTGWRKRWAHIVTLNQLLKTNGYVAVGLGKVYHGTKGPGVDPENWTRWITVGGQGYATKASRMAKRKNSRGRGPSTESADVPDDTYPDGNRAKVGAAQIYQLVKAGKPFFLAVGFTKPHLPFVAPKKYWDLYERNKFAMPTNRGVPPGYPQYARNVNAGELRAYSDIPKKGAPADFSDVLNKRLLHGYHACVSYTDHNIGILLDALQKSGAADNTIVIVVADHGWKLGDHSSWCKHTNFECDARVPLIIRHPGMHSAKGRTKALAELVDLYPTVCDLCRLDKPKHVQGMSLIGVLKNPKGTHREFAYSSYPHGRGKKMKGVTGHSIRTPKYRYTEWWEKGTDKVVTSVLTNIEVDTGETTAVKGMTEFKRMLSSKLKKRVVSVRKK